MFLHSVDSSLTITITICASCTIPFFLLTLEDLQSHRSLVTVVAKMTQYATGVSNGGQHAQYDVHLAGWDNTDLGSPTYSFPASQTSSGEAAQNVWQHEQPEKATSAASFVTQGSNRGFSLSNMIPKMLKKSGEQKKTAVPSSTDSFIPSER